MTPNLEFPITPMDFMIKELMNQAKYSNCYFCKNLGSSPFVFLEIMEVSIFFIGTIYIFPDSLSYVGNDLSILFFILDYSLQYFIAGIGPSSFILRRNMCPFMQAYNNGSISYSFGIVYLIIFQAAYIFDYFIRHSICSLSFDRNLSFKVNDYWNTLASEGPSLQLTICWLAALLLL